MEAREAEAVAARQRKMDRLQQEAAAVIIQTHTRGMQTRARFKHGELFALGSALEQGGVHSRPAADPLRALLDSNMKLLDRYFAYASEKLDQEEKSESTSPAIAPSPPWLLRTLD